MDLVKRWYLRLATALAAAVTVWLLPAAAWANGDSPVAELARGRVRTRGFSRGLGFVGACCCLVVVLVVALIVVLIRRRRQPPTR